ncbi:hypothetical protein [Calycomorphotria hydatis]
MERTVDQPICRLTAYTEKNLRKWSSLIPLIQEVHQAALRAEPLHYGLQHFPTTWTPEDYVIPKTYFSTVSVNRSFRTSVHRDKGDSTIGRSVIAGIRTTEFQGGFLVFPKYGIAVNIGHRDVLVMDAHQLHGNTQISGDPSGRFTLVCYLREKMSRCLPWIEEQEAYLSRWPGEPLFKQ